MNEIWQTLAKLIGLCFLEEMSCLFIHDEKLGKTVRLVFGLLFLAVLLGPLLNLFQIGDLLSQINFEGLTK